MPKPGDALVSGRAIMQYWNTPFSVVAAMFHWPTRLTRPVSASAAAGTRRETHKDRRAATRIGDLRPAHCCGSRPRARCAESVIDARLKELAAGSGDRPDQGNLQRRVLRQVAGEAGI